MAAAVADPASATSTALKAKVPGVFYLTDYISGTPDLTGTTDYTTQLNAAHAAMYAANGGILMFPAGKILIAGQVYLPNDGGLIPAPTQKAIKWQGTGGYYNGQSAIGVGGTRLILTYVGATYNDAKIITRGLGVFRIEDMVLQDTTANAVTPFLFTTCTTLKVSNCAFLGTTGGTSCAQDAIVLGGTIDYPTGPTGNGYGDPDAPFQGYGTVISGNYFNYIRRGVYGRMYCNQTVVENNFFDKGCGTNIVGGACVEFDGGPNVAYAVGTDAFNVITGNYFENTGGYYYQVKLTACAGTYVAGNAGEDSSPGGVLVAFVGCFGYTRSSTNYPSANNNIIGSANAIGVTLFEDALSLGRNLVIGNGSTDGNRIPTKLTIGSPLFVPDITSIAFYLRDGTSNKDLFNISGTARTLTTFGPIKIAGNADVGGAAVLTVGDASAGTSGTINITPSTTGVGSIQFKRGTTPSWLLYDAGGAASLYLRDSANAKMHLTFSAGAGVGGNTDINSNLTVKGNAGFYGVASVARAAAIATPTAPGAAYVQAEAAAMKTAVDALRVALTNLGLTS
jgi:hypothetical protein